MPDTEDILKSLERDIKKVYTKSYNELKVELDKVQSMLSTIPDSDPKKRYLLLKKDRLQSIERQMIDIEAHANETAIKMITNRMHDVYKYNYNTSADQLGFSVLDNSAVKKILTKEENPFVLVKKLTNKPDVVARLQGEFTSSLLQGESIQKMARRFKNVAEKDLSNAVRVARTETTRVQNSAKMDIGKHGEELGFVMMKRWVATTDHRTRDDHLAMNGEEVEQDEPFVLPDGSKMMFPGDISLGADASQVCNCRCTVVEFIKRDENGNLVMKN